jgi:hypothetical protein
MHRRDGALTLCIRHEAPEGEKRANWIPAPAGPSFIAGRFYGPGGFADRWFIQDSRMQTGAVTVTGRRKDGQLAVDSSGRRTKRRQGESDQIIPLPVICVHDGSNRMYGYKFKKSEKAA